MSPKATKFKDGETHFIPGDLVGFSRKGELAEGVLVVDRVDPETKTIYLSGPMPAGINIGDELVKCPINH